MKTLVEMVKELPPEAQDEVRDFVEFLLSKKRKRKQKYLRMDWAGGLREYRDQYTSLELQKKALEWRGDRVHVFGRHQCLAGASVESRQVGSMEAFYLDFDDAYQYVAAQKHDLTLVSFDKDFDRTEKKKKTPAEIMTR